MGLVKLELRSPKSPNVILSIDPDPHWTFDSLIFELGNLELKFKSPPSPMVGTASPYKQDHLGFYRNEESHTGGDKPFTMCISDDGMEDEESEDDESPDINFITGTRFSAVELDLSDFECSDDELDLKTETRLMEKTCLAEGFLFELEREQQIIIKDEIRKRVSALEQELRTENEKSASAVLLLEKYAEARREMDGRLDKQYQYKIAEALDNHLSIIQRDHEQRSQIEERRIQNDAALEEAKMKEKAIYEERMCQEKAKSEAEARLKAERIAEEKQKAALEVARRAAREGAEKDVSKMSKAILTEDAHKELAEQKRDVNEALPRTEKDGDLRPKENISGGTRSVMSTGIKVRAVQSAINAESQRLAIYNELAEKNKKFMLNSNKDFGSHERQIHKKIKQITGTVESVRAKANDLIKIINHPECPHIMSLMMFAKKVVSICENPGASFDGAAFACGYVILLVTSRVPALMDLVLAEFHKACIYTVPKYIESSEKKIRTKEYLKMIGRREEDGNAESLESYLARVGSYMKLYGVLIQTEISGFQNPHGLKEGWMWLARFLNGLPANVSTAVALLAFLQMAGFALFRKYKSQFIKMINVISRLFLPALKAQRDPELVIVIGKLEFYIEKKKFLDEPEGWRLSTSLVSGDCRP